MADNEEGEASAPRGNDWEVVSLTASAYDAAPGPEQVGSSHDSEAKLGGENEAETSSAMFMSGHFVFPPSQHENLPLYSELRAGKSDDSLLVADEEGKSHVADEKNVSSKELISNEYPGIQISDEKGSSLSASGADFENDAVFEKEYSIYETEGLQPFHYEATMDRSATFEEGEGTDDKLVRQDHSSDSGSLNLPERDEGGKYDDGDLPCEAWWKRRALSLYAHAKEANTFWSIFVAAAVMGLVIIGRRWQQERWEFLHLKSQFGISTEV